jgi:hypothetical protein
MESLLGASAEARQALRVGKRVDDLLDFDERRWVAVAEEQGDCSLVLGALMDEVDAE